MNMPDNDPLRDLIRSTLDFYARFGVKSQVADAVRNFQEEVRELIEAASAGQDKDHIAEEAADVMVTIVGVCDAAGVDAERLVAQLYAVIAKNDAKTHETHVVFDGKIRRRVPKA
jgi:NTP pyrophosphatase (non-canonical NTP hydrolase)